MKARLDLLPADALLAAGAVMAHGEAKHGARPWQDGRPWSEDYAAALRHLRQWQNGEPPDDETGESHLAHALCRIAMLLGAELRGIGTDDRVRG